MRAARGGYTGTVVLAYCCRYSKFVFPMTVTDIFLDRIESNRIVAGTNYGDDIVLGTMFTELAKVRRRVDFSSGILIARHTFAPCGVSLRAWLYQRQRRRRRRRPQSTLDHSGKPELRIVSEQKEDVARRMLSVESDNMDDD